MSSQALQLVEPASMSIQDVLSWVVNCSSAVAVRCGEAKAYYEQLEVYHKNIAELMVELSALKQKNDSKEEVFNIVETVREIYEAINSLRTHRDFVSEDAVLLDDIEEEFSKTKPVTLALQAVELEGKTFLAKYNQHKARLGLKTQEDVAKLTGLDRRYVSILERGMHKPQFKTIKRIADAFGVEVKELME